jgi:hypothetical protein
VLDEKALRRPGFRDDCRVRLADGQEWSLPKPRIRISRRTAEDGSRKLVESPQLGPDYATVLEAYESAVESGDGAALAMFDLAAALLRENYTLTDQQADTLLEFRPDDPENDVLWGAILSTARGRAPKPSGSGDDQA